MSDIGARVYVEDGDYEVWIGPADDLAAWNIINAFIAGVGRTRDEAVAGAVRELEAVVALLQTAPQADDAIDPVGESEHERSTRA